MISAWALQGCRELSFWEIVSAFERGCDEVNEFGTAVIARIMQTTASVFGLEKMWGLSLECHQILESGNDRRCDGSASQAM